MISGSRGELSAKERYSIFAYSAIPNSGSRQLMTDTTVTTWLWCINDDARSGNGPASKTRAAPGAQDDLVTTVTNKTVYVDLTC